MSSTGLAAAAQELLARFNTHQQFFEDFSWNGMSTNMAAYNDTLSKQFYAQGGHRGDDLGPFLKKIIAADPGAIVKVSNTPTPTTSTSTFPGYGAPSAPNSYGVGLPAAARELLARYDSGGPIFEDFSFYGESTNMDEYAHVLSRQFDATKAQDLRGFLAAIVAANSTGTSSPSALVVGTSAAGAAYDADYSANVGIDLGNPRVIAQDIRTGKFLHWDIPVHELSITSTLSGPGAITGKLDPDVPDLRDAGLKPWSTWIHVEGEDGLMRASGILVTPFGVNGSERSLEVVGVTAAIQDVLYEGVYSKVSVDPLQVVRDLWTYAQNFPGGDLGVLVSNQSSTVRIGGQPPAATSTLTGPRIEEDEATETSNEDGTTTTEYKPYELNWWEATKIGAEIDKLAQNTPFDYVEHCSWNFEKTKVIQLVDLGWPRAGTRRFDLRFVDGENIRDSIPINQRDDAYVTDVRVFGAGEGRDMIRASASRALTQLRRIAVVTEKAIKTYTRAKAVADAELRRRATPQGIEKVLVAANHENAPYGSYSVGDDIFVQTEVDWIGEVNMWHRITAMTYTPDEDAVDITLLPSDTFRYGSDA